MKKKVLTVLLCTVLISIYAQSRAQTESLKYGATAPDGSIAFTIIDDFKNNTLTLESINSFYKYQLLDTRTSEPVFSSNNKGAICIIDKSKIASGTYNLRLFTKSFIITTELKLSPSLMSEGGIAMTTINN